MFLELFKLSTRKQDPETRFGKASILWGGFLFSILIYLQLPWMMLKAGDYSFSGAPSWLFPAMVGLVVFIIGFQVYLRTIVAERTLFPKIADEKNKYYRGRQSQALLSLPIEERGRQAIYDSWLQYFIIQWCFGVSIAIYGLLLFLLMGNVLYPIGFCSVGLIDLLLYYPRKGPILDQIERWKRYRATHPA